MSTSIRRGTCVAFATLLAGCSLLVGTSDLSQGVAPAGSTDGAVPDAVAAPTCSQHVAGSALPALLPLDPRWTYRGVARTDELGAALTLGEPYSAGAIWWTEPTELDRFDVTSVVRLRAVAGKIAADGLAFAWVRGEVPDPPDNSGGTLGISGLSGYAVALDVLGQLVKVLDTSRTPDTRQLTASKVLLPVDDKDHVLRVRHDAGTVAVWFDAAPVIKPFAIPAYATMRGAYGFSAATGGGVMVQHVTRASFRTELCP